jgi:carboxyl-terminal processing protease
MKPTRSILLLVSTLLVLVLVGAGFSARVGAGENSYHQVVVFSEVLSLVLENYVDPVDADRLLLGAYEGMLRGLDPNGAYLTPGEVEEWKAGVEDAPGDPGVSVLKAGRALQVVAVEPGSPAAEAGVQVGDHIRSVDGRSVRDLSLTQAWRLVRGPAKSMVTLDLLHPSAAFKQETLTVARVPRGGRPYGIEVDRRGVAVLRIRDMTRLRLEELVAELDDVRSRGVDQLLLDLRNVADLRPRAVAAVAGLFAPGASLRLRDRSGRLVETVESPPADFRWSGSVSVLVNGATAGSAEALASLVQSQGLGRILGEATYGLGAEVKLYELDDGSGLLVSSALWETSAGHGWNAEGVQPDEVVRGRGDDWAAVSADQLQQTLERIEERRRAESSPGREAA